MFEAQYVGELQCNNHNFFMLLLSFNSADHTCCDSLQHTHTYMNIQAEDEMHFPLPGSSSLSGIRREMFSLSISNRVRFPISSHLFHVFSSTAPEKMSFPHISARFI